MRRLEDLMQHVITVALTSNGWAVMSGENPPLMYETSAQAVWSARKVGEATASSGVPAEIRVLDRDGRQAGRLLCPAACLELEPN
jgi:hypothetical protein